MKPIMKKISIVMLAGMLTSATAIADSTYGHNAAGTGPVSATAHAKVTVKVPLLVLLRVGSPGAVIDELTFTAAPTGMTTDGDSQAISWDGTAPVFTSSATPGDTLNAYGWTNAPNNAELTCNVLAADAFDAASGLTSADVTVTSSGALAHPGADTTCGGATTITKNTLMAATWTYAVSPTALQNAAAGTHSEIITYTATTL